MERLTRSQCVREVQHYATHLQEYPLESSFVPAVERGISKSDSFVSEEVDRDICQVVSRSVNHSSSFIDVLTNAIDPSHFPFAFGRTRVLKDGDVGREDCIELCGKGEVVAQPPDGDAALRGKGCYANDKAWSTRYQWLPFDVC